MKYLLDSNILLRMLFIADPQSPIVHQGKSIKIEVGNERVFSE